MLESTDAKKRRTAGHQIDEQKMGSNVMSPVASGGVSWTAKQSSTAISRFV
jgi:hypothetical protein